MIAYTAWDSLQSIARQFDAYLTISPEETTVMTPHRGWCTAAPVRRLADRLRAGFLALYTG